MVSNLERYKKDLDSLITRVLFSFFAIHERMFARGRSFDKEVRKVHKDKAGRASQNRSLISLNLSELVFRGEWLLIKQVLPTGCQISSATMRSQSHAGTSRTRPIRIAGLPFRT